MPTYQKFRRTSIGRGVTSKRLSAPSKNWHTILVQKAKALASVEPKVVDAVVPLLIKELEWGLEKGWSVGRVSDTLEVITAQDFGEDASLWRDWWEKRQ